MINPIIFYLQRFADLDVDEVTNNYYAYSVPKCVIMNTMARDRMNVVALPEHFLEERQSRSCWSYSRSEPVRRVFAKYLSICERGKGRSPMYMLF